MVRHVQERKVMVMEEREPDKTDSRKTKMSPDYSDGWKQNWTAKWD
jgi:hypothetical protein